MPANTTFTAGAILTAQQMNNLPWGIVDATSGGTSGRGFVNRTSGDVSIGTTVSDMTGLTVTFTATTGRLYRINMYGYIANSGTGAQDFVFQITTGANVVAQTAVFNVLAAKSTALSMSVVLSGLTGAQTYKVRGRAVSNTGAILIASTVNEGAAVFSIEDVGPSA